MKHPNLCSPMSLYAFALKHFFGMPEKSLTVYVDDESGPHEKPFPGTNTHFRIHHLLHRSFVRACTEPRLAQTTKRFYEALVSNMKSLDVETATSIQTSDMFQYLLKPVSMSITEAFFGPMLLKLNPSFFENLWAYDAELPWMARGIPSFLMPRPYRLRDRLGVQIKKWQSYAHVNFRKAHIKADGSDPFWGSELVRHLWQALRCAGAHDADAMSAHHLSMVFA